MSQWYTERVHVPILSNQRSLGKKQQSMETVLSQLKKTRPDLAARLAGVDWRQIVEHVARQALRQTAAAHGGVFEEETGGKAPAGTKRLGTIRSKDGRTRLGLALKGMQLSFFWRGGTRRMNERQKAWSEDFERAYREQALAAALRIIGTGGVVRQEGADGTVRLTAEIKEVG